MNSQMVQAQVDADKGTGGGVPKLAIFRIEQFTGVWPSMEEQVRIVKRADALDLRIESESQALRVMKQTKLGLMDDLLTGRVRVTSLLA